MVGERAQAVFDAVNAAPRTWTRGQFSVTVSFLSLDVAKNQVIIDAHISYKGILIADDRFRFVNPPQKTGDGTFTTVRRYTTSSTNYDVWMSTAEFNALPAAQRNQLTATADTTQRENVTLNPLLALKVQLEQVVRTITKDFTITHLMRNSKGEFKGDTLAVTAGTADGTVSSIDAVYATMCTGSGLTSNTTNTSVTIIWSLNGNPTGQYYFVPFDTSALTAAATITAAVYTFYGNTTAERDIDNFNLEVRYKAFGTVTTADWFDPRTPTWNALVSGGLLDIGSWVQTSGTANNLSDSGVYSSISKTSTTEIVVGMSGMNSASAPTGRNEIVTQTADTAGTTTDPLLTITYTLPKSLPLFKRPLRIWNAR